MSEFTERHEKLCELEQLVAEFFRLVDKVEESDGGRFFRPNQFVINSCRAMDGHRLGQIIPRMKEIVGAPPPTSDEELEKLNTPNNENVCPTCKGTGDYPCDHEREWVDCITCEGSGLVKECEHCNGDGFNKDNVHHEDWTCCVHCTGSGLVPDKD